MTAPRFRSTAAFTMRQRRAGPVIDRATFVIFSVDGRRFAAPAESVERVLRHADDSADTSIVEHLGRQIPLIDFRDALRDATRGFAGVSYAATNGSSHRTLVFSVREVWVAALVDAVYEVATIDATLVQPIEVETLPVSAPTIASEAVRGRFLRHDQEVLVLDIVRVVRAVYEATNGAAQIVRPGAAAPPS